VKKLFSESLLLIFSRWLLLLLWLTIIFLNACVSLSKHLHIFTYHTKQKMITLHIRNGGLGTLLLIWM